MSRCISLLLLAALFAQPGTANEPAKSPVYPGKTWQTRKPEDVGLDAAKLEQLRDLVGGHGCIVRHGYLVFAWGDSASGGVRRCPGRQSRARAGRIR